MLIYLDDKTLNKFMPLKRLAPFREIDKINNKYMHKQKLSELARELEKKKVSIDIELFLINFFRKKSLDRRLLRMTYFRIIKSF